MVLLSNHFKTIIKMKKTFLLGIISLFFVATSCSDPDLDPLQFNKIQNGASLALRGDAFDNLFDRTFYGSSAKFSVSGTGSEKFEFEADFIAKDINTLSKAEVFAQFKNGTRAKVADVAGTSFTVPSGGRYPRAKISIPLATILQATGTKLSSFDPENFDYISIQTDITLTDGRIVKASSLVNSSMFESDHFYPAHNLRFLAVK